MTDSPDTTRAPEGRYHALLADRLDGLAGLDGLGLLGGVAIKEASTIIRALSGFGVDHENHEALREKVARLLREHLYSTPTSGVLGIPNATDAILAVLQSKGGGQR